MLDSIYHMTLKLLNNRILSCSHLIRNVIIDVFMLRYQICKQLVVYQFYCMPLSLLDARRHVIKVVCLFVLFLSCFYCCCVLFCILYQGNVNCLRKCAASAIFSSFSSNQPSKLQRLDRILKFCIWQV